MCLGTEKEDTDTNFFGSAFIPLEEIKWSKYESLSYPNFYMEKTIESLSFNPAADKASK